MMLVDCHTCPVRDVHCADCMVTALAAIPVGLHDPEHGLALDRAERRAVSVLLAAGLVTPEVAHGARAMADAPMMPHAGRAAV